MKFPEIDKEHFPQSEQKTGEWAPQADLASKEAAIQSWEAKATEYANEINALRERLETAEENARFAVAGRELAEHDLAQLREQLMANTVPAVGDVPVAAGDAI